MKKQRLMIVAVVLHIVSIGLVVAGAVLRGRMFILLVLAALVLTVVSRSVADRARQ